MTQYNKHKSNLLDDADNVSCDNLTVSEDESSKYYGPELICTSIDLTPVSVSAYVSSEKVSFEITITKCLFVEELYFINLPSFGLRTDYQPKLGGLPCEQFERAVKRAYERSAVAEAIVVLVAILEFQELLLSETDEYSWLNSRTVFPLNALVKDID